MKSINVALKEIFLEAKNRGERELPYGLVLNLLTDPFGNYGFRLWYVKERLEELMDRGLLQKKGANILLR